MTEGEMLEHMQAIGKHPIHSVYVGGKVTGRERLKRYRGDIRYLGFKCPSTWMDVATDYPADFASDRGFDTGIKREAIRDLEQISDADLFILDTYDITETGGREFEAGYAYAKGKHFWVVGPLRNLFHLKAHRHFLTWNSAIFALEEISRGSTDRR